MVVRYGYYYFLRCRHGVDADFTNISNVETLTGHTGNSSITLGPLATAAGIVNVSPGTGTNTVTIPPLTLEIDCHGKRDRHG